MSYTLVFTDQSVDPLAKAPISVAVGSVDTTSTDVTLTGKGAANFGKLQQENILHLLENFASGTAPSNPTVGQLWYDASTLTLKVLISTAPDTWKSLAGIQVTNIGDPPPAPAALGDVWFEVTGTGSGFMYVYTGLGRYPTTATTIGGWEQIFPRLDTAAGREEYDAVRLLVEQLLGEAVSSYGNGAIGRSIANLTNFAALDLDLRTKYQALGADDNVLVSTIDDTFITSQDLSTTLFLLSDQGGVVDGANDFMISGSRNDTAPSPSVPGSIFINGVSTSVPADFVWTYQFVENAYILYDQTGTLNVGPEVGPHYYAVVQFNPGTGSWEYDNNTPTWVPFVPTADHFIIGTFSVLREDTLNDLPGGKNGFIWAHAVPMVGPKIEHLKVEPNANDWDELLAAAKYALNRLELPVGFVRSVSSNPFVNDGRQAPGTLLSLPATNVRYPTGTRRSNRRIGMVSHVQAFSETVNALNTGIENRFSLKGINGATGTNPNFASTTTVASLAAAGPVNTGSTTRTLNLTVSFTDHDEFYRWMSAGSGLQIQFTHTGANPADVNLISALNEIGVLRITADRTRVFGASLPLTASRPVAIGGIWNLNDGSVIGTQQFPASGSPIVTMSIAGVRVSPSSFTLTIVLTTLTNLAGSTNVSVEQIYDNETYTMGMIPVFPTIASQVISLT